MEKERYFPCPADLIPCLSDCTISRRYSFEVAALAFPFLPWWLSMPLYFILLSLPVFIAVGLLSGNRSARWLAVVLAAASLIMVYSDMASYSSQQIIIQSILHPALLLLIFNPVSNRYFANAAPKTES